MKHSTTFRVGASYFVVAWLMLSDTGTTPGGEPFTAAAARAEKLLDLALEIDPELASAHAVKGLLLTLTRDFDDAERSLARALELNPSHSDALNWRAVNLRNAGRLRDELNARHQLLEIDPLHLSNLFNLSITHLLMGQADQALAVARRLKTDFPESPWGDLAEVEALMGSGRLAQARELARARLADGSGMLVSTASDVEMRLGNFTTAIEVSGTEFGMALIGQGRIDDAVALARALVASAPGESNAALSLLRVMSLAGRHAEVLEFFRKRWGSLDTLQEFFEFQELTGEVAPIAVAQLKLERDEALADTLSHWRERLAEPRRQGYALPYFHYLEAEFEALSGNREAALTRIEDAIEGGYLDPLLELQPAFLGLADDPGFQRLAARNLERIDAERAKLGLEPLGRAMLARAMR